mmetsp:Transcript_9485/g.23279  ORF Transcript_9485/g.23279 Transcript_9485/m.23279 type:complete len:148 (-) Transcript_9485:594-1037(-)|eukprot:CAMPEP_0197184726 /NCGR_PEP_ID=MMETSP1423-20130617/10432_1 /TAXON_ID=476441 /ORGANISM="Pseudo-nitzschia heimii, Strain UNC1101" /LENGTH=147 /DNA_ID=CAMNT_0042635613 /DNA_START=74 /DNA_END=517 /DNA_ORIENTATION=+
MNPSQQQQQQVLAHMEKNNDFDDDYLQVLDAGEHMFGMFVSNDDDLHAYLNVEDPLSSWNIPPIDDIEDVISRSIVSGLDIPQHEQCAIDDYYCASIADMHIHEQGSLGAEVSSRNDDTNGDNDSAKTGRLTPTPNEDVDHDAMSQR